MNTRLSTIDGLTPKQELFAQQVAKGQTLADAYRHSYDASGSKDNTIHGAASDLMANPRVSARVNELLKEQERMMLRDSVAIRRHVMRGLMRESEAGLSDDDSGATAMSRLKALELLGKVDIVSMFKDRVEQENKDRKPEEVEKVLNERLRAILARGINKQRTEPKAKE
jgi:hypothetical protein